MENRAKERQQMGGLRLIKARKPAKVVAVNRRRRLRAAVKVRRAAGAAAVRRVSRAVRKPTAQIFYAAALALAGAWLIALWAVGLVLIVFAVLIGVDALFREDVPEQPATTTHDEILERWRNVR